MLPSVRRGKAAGFTLLEMMITLAIFILLSAAVFETIAGVVQSASTLQDNQNRRDQLAALNAFLSKNLRGMAAQSVLISYLRNASDGLKQNGVIFGQDETLTAIDATPQSNGYYLVRLATFDPSTLPPYKASPMLVFEAAVVRNDSVIAWTPLIRDVRQIDWKFQAYNATEWVDMWSDSTNKPNLAEFTMEQAGDSQPSVMDFWIPRVSPVELILNAAPASPPPPSSTPVPPAPNSPKSPSSSP